MLFTQRFIKYIYALFALMLSSTLYAGSISQYTTIMYDGLVIVVPLQDKTAPEKPTLGTSIPTETNSSTLDVEVHGEVGADVYANGVKVGTIGADGKAVVQSSLINGINAITITLKDDAGNESKGMQLSVIYTGNGSELKQIAALRFINKATFGASTEEVNRLQKIGINTWLDEELAKPKTDDIYLTNMIKIAKMNDSSMYHYSIADYLADNDHVFYDFHSGETFRLFDYFSDGWFETTLKADDQLRHRVAYALSQIIVESTFEPMLRAKAEGLAHYYDVLYRNAFGNYKTLLEEISINPGMGVYLTHYGNQKKYTNSNGVEVYPDENYAREIMQLFSIGLNKLNMDGTPVLDANGSLIPTYTQNDVNELSRVFTGWDLKRSLRFGVIRNGDGDFTHPMEATDSYHDFGSKTLLGQTIPANLTPLQDMHKAIDIIMSQDSVAPYIAKNLIMRLTKSNPSPDYIERVATVFKNNNWDLKKTVKAIFTDSELLNDLDQDNIVKFKEPLLAYMQFLKAMHIEPLPYWYTEANAQGEKRTEQYYHFGNIYRDTAQAPGEAPSVFNFYDNDFVPNDDGFKNPTPPLHAPEVQIQTDPILIRFSNRIRVGLYDREKGYRIGVLNNGNYDAFHDDRRLYKSSAEKYLIDAREEFYVFEMALDGDTDGDFNHIPVNGSDSHIKANEAVKAFIDYADLKFTGGLLSQEQKDALYNNLKDTLRTGGGNNKKGKAYNNAIMPIIRAIVTSDAYMVE